MRPRRTFVVAAALALVAGSTIALAAVSAAPPAPVACDTSAGACWKPPLNARWQYQLQPMAQYASTGGVNVDICAVPSTGGACVRPAVFDFDLYDVDAAGREGDLLRQRGDVGRLATRRGPVPGVGQGLEERLAG